VNQLALVVVAPSGGLPPWRPWSRPFSWPGQRAEGVADSRRTARSARAAAPTADGPPPWISSSWAERFEGAEGVGLVIWRGGDTGTSRPWRGRSAGMGGSCESLQGGQLFGEWVVAAAECTSHRRKVGRWPVLDGADSGS